MSLMKYKFYTIGYSSHSLSSFVDRLKMHGITAVCDVRSSPYSKFKPEFNREKLKQQLKTHGIAYVFIGEELGARSNDPQCYDNGQVQFDRLGKTLLFQRGLDRIRKGIKKYSIVLMCAEKDPLVCHRMILVCRQVRHEFDIWHILEDGTLENQKDTEVRLLKHLRIQANDLFRSEEELIASAYALQGKKIGYIKQ